jgi:integral membrane protein (TIGR01906 family)
VAPVALGLLLVTTTVRCAAESLPLYEALFERHSVSERTGIAPEGLAHVGREVQAYFASGSDGPLSVEVEVFGVPRELFNANEVSHMADVKALFLRVYRVQWVSAVLLVALTLLAAWRLRREAVLVTASWLRRGAALTAAIVLVLGLLSVVAFQQVFRVFHYIGFPQGNWVFDPRTEYLVQVFPFGFWRDITLLIGAVILLGTAALWGAGAFLRKRGGRERSEP